LAKSGDPTNSARDVKGIQILNDKADFERQLSYSICRVSVLTTVTMGTLRLVEQHRAMRLAARSRMVRPRDEWVSDAVERLEGVVLSPPPRVGRLRPVSLGGSQAVRLPLVSHPLSSAGALDPRSCSGLCLGTCETL